MPKQVINPPQLFDSLQYGFSQIAIGEGSRIITISGQVGWDAAENIVSDDLEAQTVKAFENLKIALEAAGGALADVLSMRIYIVASVMEQSSVIAPLLKRYFPTDPPTTNWIGVVCLADKAFLIEIEAMAVL